VWSSNYGQVAAIIFTASTFSFGDIVRVLAAPLGAVLLAESSEPVISTLWPTCGVSFASSVSRRYSLTPALAEPAVPVVAVVPIDAFLSTNFVSSLRDPLVPVVPVVAAAVSDRCKQPVTVMFLDAMLDAAGGGCVWVAGGGGCCAVSPVVSANAPATHVPIHVLLFIVPPFV
jgi:hypothetical protein